MTTFRQDIAKILLDKFLIGALLALFGLYLGRLLERYKSDLGYGKTLALKQVEDANLLANIVAEFHQRYVRWLDELEDLAKRLRTGETSPAEIAAIVARWNTVNAALTSNVYSLQSAVPESLAERLNVYHGIASRLVEVFQKPGAEAARWTDLVKEGGFRADLEAAFGKFLDVYAQVRSAPAGTR